MRESGAIRFMPPKEELPKLATTGRWQRGDDPGPKTHGIRLECLEKRSQISYISRKIYSRPVSSLSSKSTFASPGDDGLASRSRTVFGAAPEFTSPIGAVASGMAATCTLEDHEISGKSTFVGSPRTYRKPLVPRARSHVLTACERCRRTLPLLSFRDLE